MSLCMKNKHQQQQKGGGARNDTHNACRPQNSHTRMRTHNNVTKPLNNMNRQTGVLTTKAEYANCMFFCFFYI